MKRLTNLFYSITFLVLAAAAFSFVLDTPFLPTLAVVGVLCAFIPMPKGTLNGVVLEQWAAYIIERFWKDNAFLKLAYDDSDKVQGGRIVHIPQVGAKPTVVKNRSVFPATAVRRTDTDILYALDEYTTDPTHIYDIGNAIYYQSNYHRFTKGPTSAKLRMYFDQLPLATTPYVLYYNTDSGKVTYGAAPSGGGSMVYPPTGIPVSNGSGWGTSITNNSANWNTAYSWGNHSGLYKPLSYAPAWSELTGPAAVAGSFAWGNGLGSLSSIGIGAFSRALVQFKSTENAHIGYLYPNAITESRIWNLPNGSGTIALTTDLPSGTNTTNWNTAFGWGNHAGLYPLLSGSYNNPSWLNQLGFNKIINLPTSLAGYGITDGLTQAQANALYAAATHSHTLQSITATGNVTTNAIEAGNFVTNYGYLLNNGATKFIIYNNGGDNGFSIRDITNAQNLIDFAAYTANRIDIHRNLYVPRINLNNRATFLNDAYRKDQADSLAAAITAQLGSKMDTTYSPSLYINNSLSGDGVETSPLSVNDEWIDSVATARGYIKTKQEHLIVALSDETTALTTGTKIKFRMPYSATITEIKASLNTAASSGTTTLNIKESDASILGSMLTIDPNEKTSATAAEPVSIDYNVVEDFAEMSIDVDVAGTGATGGKVYIYYTRTPEARATGIQYNFTSALAQPTGTVFTLTAGEPVDEYIIATYTKQAGDVNAVAFAAHLNAAINAEAGAQVSGYTSVLETGTVANDTIRVTARPGLGHTLNGQSLILSWNSGAITQTFSGGL